MFHGEMDAKTIGRVFYLAVAVGIIFQSTLVFYPKGFNGDAADSSNRAADMLEGKIDLYTEDNEGYMHYTLYILPLAVLFKLFFLEEYWVKILIVAYNLVFLFFLHQLAKTWFDEKVARITLILGLYSSWVTYQFNIWVPTATMMPVAAIALAENKDRRWKTLGFLLCGFSFYFFHTNEVVIITYLVLYALFNHRDYRTTVTMIAIAVLVASPAITATIKDVGKDKVFSYVVKLAEKGFNQQQKVTKLSQKGEIGETKKGFATRVFDAFINDRDKNEFKMGRWNYGANPILVLLSTASALWMGVKLVFIIREKRLERRLPEFFLLSVMTIFFVGIGFTPFIEPRVLYFASPVILMLSGILISEFKGNMKYITLLLVILYCLQEVAGHAEYFMSDELIGKSGRYKRWKAGLRETTEYLVSKNPEGVIVEPGMQHQVSFYRRMFGEDSFKMVSGERYFNEKKTDRDDYLVNWDRGNDKEKKTQLGEKFLIDHIVYDAFGGKSVRIYKRVRDEPSVEKKSSRRIRKMKVKKEILETKEVLEEATVEGGEAAVKDEGREVDRKDIRYKTIRCHKLRKKLAEQWCYVRAAIETKNPWICGLIDREQYRESCYEGIENLKYAREAI
ncbi:MAG: hypothetical protein ABIH11_02385 [Candidatus Altiarchaeota archaeon]